MLSVRLCKPGGVSCTSFQGFSYGTDPYANFSGLTAYQKYYIDIRNSWPNYSFWGKLNTYN